MTKDEVSKMSDALAITKYFNLGLTEESKLYLKLKDLTTLSAEDRKELGPLARAELTKIAS
jgi:hypothetical protein